MSLDPLNEADCKEISAILNSAIQYNPGLLARPAYAHPEPAKVAHVKESIDKLPMVLND